MPLGSLKISEFLVKVVVERKFSMFGNHQYFECSKSETNYILSRGQWVTEKIKGIGLTILDRSRGTVGNGLGRGLHWSEGKKINKSLWQ